jgi:hypothetical protein
MRSRGLRRNAIAAWLGILALAIQALIPALLAAEIELARSERGQSVFTLCAFGHLHVAAAHDDGGQAPDNPEQDDDVGTTCPICVALLASPAFTAPPQVAVPLPAVATVETFAATPTQAPAAFVIPAYRSRAPPIA